MGGRTSSTGIRGSGPDPWGLWSTPNSTMEVEKWVPTAYPSGPSRSRGCNHRRCRIHGQFPLTTPTTPFRKNEAPSACPALRPPLNRWNEAR